MSAKTKPKVFDDRGVAVRLGDELGRGGEGSVFLVPDRPNMVAKVYHGALDPVKAEKLSTMVRLRSDRLLALAAWPIDTLHDRPGGSIAGLLMPKVSGFREIHTLYSPKSRMTAFPNAGVSFLVHSAANVARAFKVIHEHGHVIGDVNHGNLLVSDQATVKLIDCDSFQVVAQGRHYYCEVGVATHTPPELQGRPFHGVTRTPNHDAFGLAVLLFQLLFLGRHPFSGRYMGPGDMPIEKAITELRFAYGSRSASRQMFPPPGTPSLSAASAPVASLFERAFSPTAIRDGGRPTPQEWEKALIGLAQAFKTCGRNSAHQFPNTISSCPWCEVEARSGTTLFNIVIVGTRQSKGTFDIDAVWAQIAGVRSPGPLPFGSQMISLQVEPSAKAVELGRKRRKRKMSGAGLVVIAIVGIMMFSIGGAVALWTIAGALIVAVAMWKADPAEIKTFHQEAEDGLRKAQAQLVAARERWRGASEEPFDAKLRYLEARKTELRDLPAKTQQQLRQLEANREALQRHRFLDSHRIDQAWIVGIGAGRHRSVVTCPPKAGPAKMGVLWG
ncbi:MAG: hypothetical protein M3Q03_15840 [Chloroflexota bacterium]|nr:hypothetical protein [Chloroflexota bacterium]